MIHNDILTLLLLDFSRLLKSLNLVKIDKTEIIVIIFPACESSVLVSRRVH